MLSALKTSSVKAKLSGLDDLDAFMNSLSDSEKAVIKSALAYEDYNYPYIDDVIEGLSQEYSEYKNNNYTKRTPQVSELLYYQNKNTPKNYDFLNTNYRRYNQFSNYYDSLKSYNNYNRYDSPTDVFSGMMNTWKYGKATDLYGNKYSGYTNIKGDTWTYGGKK
jgi:hypothetical protein